MRVMTLDVYMSINSQRYLLPSEYWSFSKRRQKKFLLLLITIPGLKTDQANGFRLNYICIVHVIYWTPYNTQIYFFKSKDRYDNSSFSSTSNHIYVNIKILINWKGSDIYAFLYQITISQIDVIRHSIDTKV